MNPFALLALWTSTATFLAETQTVMSLRLMAIGGMIPSRPGENKRMLAEKLPALAKSQAAAGTALLAGKRPDQVMSAAMAPLSSKVHANRKRLMR